MTIANHDNPSRTFGIRHSVLIVLLTILAGCLRFYSLDKPSIWGDEVQTWRRVSGTYQQLLDELRTAGFMPGDYLLTWWIKDGFPVWGHYAVAPPSAAGDRERGWFRRFGEGRDPSRVTRAVWTPSVRLIPGGLTPTPMVMRFVPALCGTLMVPAMYLLASRMVTRRTALLAALFTCCSAYMLGYSRDAKMYAQLWFFATLHVGCLLWWLEAYKRQPIVLLNPARRPWSKQDELGAGVSGVLSAEHVGNVARAFIVDADLRATLGSEAPRVRPEISRLDTLLRFTCWLAAGLAMIAFQTIGLAIVGIELIIVLATIPQRVGWLSDLFAHMSGRFNRLRSSDPYGMGAEPRLGFPRPVIPPLLSFLVGAACIVSLFLSYKQFTRYYDRIEPSAASSGQFDLDESGIDWVDDYNEGRTAGGLFLENATAYLFSWEWTKPGDSERVAPETLKRLRLAAIVLLIAIGAGLIPWKSMLDRLTGAPRTGGPMPATALLILGAWLLVPAYGIYAASGAWDEAGQRVAALPPTSAIASGLSASASPGDVEPLRGALMTIWKPVYEGTKTWSAAQKEMTRLPWRELFVVHGFELASLRYAVVGAIVGLLVIATLGWRRPTLLEPLTLDPALTEQRGHASLGARRMAVWWVSLFTRAAAIAVALVLLYALLLLAFVVVPRQAGSVWMPRYLGFIWPAFAIVVCVLIRRLPIAPIRWLVIVALLAVNLTNFWMRLQHGEPPTALIARDQITAQASGARVFAPLLVRNNMGTPGSGGPISLPAVYYYLMLKNADVAPREVFNSVDAMAARVGGNYPVAIRSTIAREPALADIYVWSQLAIDTPPGEVESKLSAALSPTWTLVEPAQRWTIYDHWTWRQLYALEREHWQRVAVAPTAKAPPAKPAAPSTPANISIRPAPPRAVTRPATTRAATRPATTRAATTIRVAATWPATSRASTP